MQFVKLDNNIRHRKKSEDFTKYMQVDGQYTLKRRANTHEHRLQARQHAFVCMRVVVVGVGIEVSKWAAWPTPKLELGFTPHANLGKVRARQHGF